MAAKVSTPREVCFYPTFGPQETGGVAVHIRSLARHLSRRGYSIVSTPNENTLIHTHAMARAYHVNVYTNHGVYPIVEKMPSWQQKANASIFDNLKLADQVIAVSNWTAAQWQHLIGRKPHVIYNAIDLDDWKDVPYGRWRGRLAIHPKTPLVVWGKTSLSSVLDPSAFMEMALRFPKWRFVAPLPPTALPSLAENVTCVGMQSFDLMRMLLNDCDVYLATVQENHSIQVLEAMALQKPIVGYDWGGTAETLRVDKQIVGGTLTAPQDYTALAAALTEAYEQREKLGKAGRALVAAKFTVDKQIDALEGVYAMAERGLPGKARGIGTRCSIVIPVYNKESYVYETVTSALRQVQAPKYEIIIVNDGSTDDSLKNAKSAAAGEQNVRIFDQPNRGVSAARNFGISHALGEYICCLDADDLIDPHFLHRLTAALDADPGLGIAFSDFVAFGTDQNGMPYESQIVCDEYDFDKLKRGNILPCCNLFRKVAWERAGGYKPINPSWEDYELWLNMGKLGWYGRRVPGYFFRYRKVAQTGRDHQSQGLEWKLRGIVNSYHRDLYAPAISVVIPSYKHSQFLSDAIESVKAQTFPDWEVVVVDDGNDNDEAYAIKIIVDGYNNADIRLVRHAQNSGLASARNTGIEHARGQWIVPLDDDDKIAPTFLEKTLRASQLDPRKFVYTDNYLWFPGSEPETKLLEAHDYDFDEALNRITWSCTILYSKDAWTKAGGYKPQMSELGGWEDWEFTISLGEIGVCGVRVPEALFYYRQHSTEQMRMSAEEKKPRLQEAIRRLHSEVYRGERTQMCCGAGKRNRQQPLPPDSSANIARTLPPLAQNASLIPLNDVIIQYVGARMGAQTWQGPSGTRYRFGLTEPLQKVKPQDVDFFLQHPDFKRVTK